MTRSLSDQWFEGREVNGKAFRILLDAVVSITPSGQGYNIVIGKGTYVHADQDSGARLFAAHRAFVERGQDDGGAHTATD